MEYRKYGDTYYIRMDKGDEVIGNILDICRKEKILSCTYSGIGGCQSAELQTFIPDKGEFETEVLDGMLELVSFTGNVITDDEYNLFHHTHAVFSYKEDGMHKMAGGHLKSTVVLYTAEITLKEIEGGVIKKKYDPVTGTGFWDFNE